MQQDAQTKAELARYNDELARKRVEFEHAKGRERNAEIVALQEESTRRQEAEKQRAAAEIEAERRATDEHRVWQAWLCSLSLCAHMLPDIFMNVYVFARGTLDIGMLSDSNCVRGCGDSCCAFANWVAFSHRPLIARLLAVPVHAPRMWLINILAPVGLHTRDSGCA